MDADTAMQATLALLNYAQGQLVKARSTLASVERNMAAMTVALMELQEKREHEKPVTDAGADKQPGSPAETAGA